MADLETDTPCSAHRGVTICVDMVKHEIGDIKAKQYDRDHELQRIYEKIEAKVSMKLFLWVVGIVISIMLGSTGINLIISSRMTASETQLANVTKNQDEIKGMIKTLFSRTKARGDDSIETP